MVTVALNGFGRIGKTFVRAIMADPRARQQLALVAINVGTADPAATAYAFKYDSLMGTYNGEVMYEDGILTIDDYAIAICAQPDATQLPWSSFGIDWVVDATGHFTHREQAELHITAGAGSVLITAPAYDVDITIIPGVNQELFDTKKHKIVSLGSCTTNAIVPMLKVLQNACGIQQAHITTVHAYTNSQALLDVDPSLHDLRKSRAAALNIIPTSTGASRAVELVLPELKGKVTGSALRIPIPTVSLADCTFIPERSVSTEDLMNAYRDAANNAMQTIVSISYEPLVSTDFQGNSSSVIIDSLLTTMQRSLGRIYGWYDNEWGYSCRLKDFLMNVDTEGI